MHMRGTALTLLFSMCVHCLRCSLLRRALAVTVAVPSRAPAATVPHTLSLTHRVTDTSLTQTHTHPHTEMRCKDRALTDHRVVYWFISQV